MKKDFNFLCLLLLFTACACTPGNGPNITVLEEIFPPVFLSLDQESEVLIRLTFDKETEFAQPPRITPEMEIEKILPQDNSILLYLSSSQEPGKEYILQGTVKDKRGNRMQFLAPFYGFNSSPPKILLNEFTTLGSTTHPDVTELRITEGGNLAGLTLFEGTRDIYSLRFTFPSLEVEAGDYILFHWKPQGIETEIDETVSKEQSGGIDSCREAWDFWLKGGSGLPGNNGVISLYSSPSGRLLDAVIYSNRTSDSDTTYLGFGSKEMMNKALSLVEQGGWIAAGERIAPEDAVNPSSSTATRSICRWEEQEDTNTALDWYIVPTGKYSFGKENSTEVYSP